MAGFVILFLLLGNNRMVRQKIWRGWFEGVSEKRFRFMAVNDVFGLFGFRCFILGSCSLRIYSTKVDSTLLMDFSHYCF